MWMCSKSNGHNGHTNHTNGHIDVHHDPKAAWFVMIFSMIFQIEPRWPPISIYEISRLFALSQEYKCPPMSINCPLFTIFPPPKNEDVPHPKIEMFTIVHGYVPMFSTPYPINLETPPSFAPGNDDQGQSPDREQDSCVGQHPSGKQTCLYIISIYI